MEISPIAYIESDFRTKFGVPRQSGLADALLARVVFEPPYRDESALRGIEDFSHLWLIWGFSEAIRKDWSPTVRPPRLGGNERVGVFASRSPFRPNALALSSVRLVCTQYVERKGITLVVAGADLMDGTPIFDIKPYVAYTDSHPDAKNGFTDVVEKKTVRVVIPDELAALLPSDKLQSLLQVLSLDPRPAYQNAAERVYGFLFAGFEVKFKVKDDVLSVVQIVENQ